MANYATYRTSPAGPLMVFSLEQAMCLSPGPAEATTVNQFAKALAFWQAQLAAGRDTARAPTAIAWIQAEMTRTQSPPANSLHLAYPV